jgi:hypothetical protein
MALLFSTRASCFIFCELDLPKTAYAPQALLSFPGLTIMSFLLDDEFLSAFMVFEKLHKTLVVFFVKQKASSILQAFSELPFQFPSYQY